MLRRNCIYFSKVLGIFPQEFNFRTAASFNNKLNSFRGFIRGFCWRVPNLVTDLVIAVQTLSGSTDNFLEIPRIFLDPHQLMETTDKCLRFRELFGTPRPISENYLRPGGFFETSESCLTLSRTVWDFRELLETSKDFLKLPRIVWDFREHCLKPPRTVWDFQELFETSENCFKLLRTVWHFQELCQILRTLQKKPWKRIVALQGHRTKLTFVSFVTCYISIIF